MKGAATTGAAGPGDEAPVRYAPGMDERSTKVAERLATPMLIWVTICSRTEISEFFLIQIFIPDLWAGTEKAGH